MSAGEVVAHVTIQQLRSCHVVGSGARALELLSSLVAPRLETLSVQDCQRVLAPNQLPPGGWSNLQQLKLLGVNLQPAVLAHLPHLRCLDVAELGLFLPSVQVSTQRWCV